MQTILRRFPGPDVRWMVVGMARYERPETVEEALALLARPVSPSDTPWTVLAGGTDFYPALGARPVTADVLDISRIAALKGIAETAGGWRIGAATTWSALRAAALPPAFAALQAAAAEVGSVQIQNRATLAGNLANASPAADGVPALMVLDAEVELSSRGGTRVLPLERFILGNRRTERSADELVTAILVPASAAAGRSAFHKLGARRYLVISIAMAAARLEIDGEGRVAAAAVALGACSPVATRLSALEEALRGQTADARLADAVLPEHFAALSPIDDVRASAAYRRHAAAEIVRRALLALAGGALERAA